MEAGDVLQVMRDAVWIILLISAPFLIVGIIVGVIVSIFQAASHVQEGTLTFVPKALLMLLLVALTAAGTITTMVEFTNGLMNRAVDIGAG
jgi:flagellar biosynthesis protein FliQ